MCAKAKSCPQTAPYSLNTVQQGLTVLRSNSARLPYIYMCCGPELPCVSCSMHVWNKGRVCGTFSTAQQYIAVKKDCFQQAGKRRQWIIRPGSLQLSNLCKLLSWLMWEGEGTRVKDPVSSQCWTESEFCRCSQLWWSGNLNSKRKSRAVVWHVTVTKTCGLPRHSSCQCGQTYSQWGLGYIHRWQMAFSAGPLAALPPLSTAPQLPRMIL